jgi:hypothetical protein
MHTLKHVGISIPFFLAMAIGPYIRQYFGYSINKKDAHAGLIAFTFFVCGLLVSGAILDISVHHGITVIICMIASMYVGYKYNIS